MLYQILTLILEHPQLRLQVQQLRPPVVVSLPRRALLYWDEPVSSEDYHRCFSELQKGISALQNVPDVATTGSSQL